MTDTTDIKALREECAQWVKDAIGEAVDTRMALNGGGNDYMSWDMSIIWLAWLHLSGKLEAERQRADNASFRENHLNDMLNDKIQQNVDLRAELAALKGDQVPVAFTGSGSLAAIKGGHEGHIWGTPADAHPVPLYDRPQKPFVLPVERVKHWREAPCNGVDWAKGWKEGWNACVKRIKAAGGIVKDGE